MSTRTARRRLPIATALIAAALVAPGSANAADLRGEYAKDPGTGSEVARATDLRSEFAQDSGTGSLVARGSDLRGEFAQAPAPLGAVASGADVRGEFAKPESRGDLVIRQVGPADSTAPSDTPSALPFIVAGLVALLGFAAIAIAVPLRRRVRVSH
jgi:hypothetical protein